MKTEYIGGFVARKQKQVKESNDDVFIKLNGYIGQLSHFNAAERNWYDETYTREKLLSNIRTLTSYLVRKGVTLDQFKEKLISGLYSRHSLFRIKDWRKLNEKN